MANFEWPKSKDRKVFTEKGEQVLKRERRKKREKR